MSQVRHNNVGSFLDLVLAVLYVLASICLNKGFYAIGSNTENCPSLFTSVSSISVAVPDCTNTAKKNYRRG